MVLVRCSECGFEKTITDSRLEYQDGENQWCPRCVEKTDYETIREVAE